MENKTIKYLFSGHESFQCRHLWLKKGYDFVKSGNNFNDADAVVKLGVGKNMVASIRFWMRAFNILDKEDSLTDFGVKLLDDGGWDPFLEDAATRWLLHYQLVSKNYSSIYSLIFNEYRREKNEFNKVQISQFLKNKTADLENATISEKTLAEDIGVFFKMYVRSDVSGKDKEDSFSGLLTELNIIDVYRQEHQTYYGIINKGRPQIPEAVILYVILQTEGLDKAINLKTIETESNNAGMVFALDRTDLVHKIEKIVNNNNKQIIYSDHAGIRELQFHVKPNANRVLSEYYAR